MITLLENTVESVGVFGYIGLIRFLRILVVLGPIVLLVLLVEFVDEVLVRIVRGVIIGLPPISADVFIPLFLSLLGLASSFPFGASYAPTSCL